MCTECVLFVVAIILHDEIKIIRAGFDRYSGLFQHRSPWCDVAQPGGLHARLCHAFRVNQSTNHLFAHNTSSSETARASRRDEQDSQAPGALMAALIKHTTFQRQM